jgi:hypothetical protein
LSKSSPRPRFQPVHRCAVDTERARHLGDGLAGGDPVQRLPPLVRGELLRSTKAYPARLGTLAALAGAGADKRPLELSKAAGGGEHELAMRRCRIVLVELSPSTRGTTDVPCA